MTEIVEYLQNDWGVLALLAFLLVLYSLRSFLPTHRSKLTPDTGEAKTIIKSARKRL
ncbi:MAG: hypothetical protein AAGA91_15945 [Pseudomonadota bacterium]